MDGSHLVAQLRQVQRHLRRKQRRRRRLHLHSPALHHADAEVEGRAHLRHRTSPTMANAEPHSQGPVEDKNYGTLKYRVDGGSWSCAVPGATNVGNYKVEARLEGTSASDIVFANNSEHHQQDRHHQPAHRQGRQPDRRVQPGRQTGEPLVGYSFHSRWLLRFQVGGLS